MLKPFLIIVAVVLVCCGLIFAIKQNVVSTTATGRPFDWMGDGVKCMKCGAGGVQAGNGYWYFCPTCKAHYTARWNADEKTIEVDW